MSMQVADELNPLRVLELFRRISAEDCILLALESRPEHLLMTHVPVPPVCIRPSVEMDTGGSNEDDLTIKLMVRMLRLSHNHIKLRCMPPFRSDPLRAS